MTTHVSFLGVLELLGGGFVGIGKALLVLGLETLHRCHMVFVEILERLFALLLHILQLGLLQVLFGVELVLFLALKVLDGFLLL